MTVYWWKTQSLEIFPLLLFWIPCSFIFQNTCHLNKSPQQVPGHVGFPPSHKAPVLLHTWMSHLTNSIHFSPKAVRTERLNSGEAQHPDHRLCCSSKLGGSSAVTRVEISSHRHAVSENGLYRGCVLHADKWLRQKRSETGDMKTNVTNQQRRRGQTDAKIGK